MDIPKKEEDKKKRKRSKRNVCVWLFRSPPLSAVNEFGHDGGCGGVVHFTTVETEQVKCIILMIAPPHNIVSLFFFVLSFPFRPLCRHTHVLIFVVDFILNFLEGNLLLCGIKSSRSKFFFSYSDDNDSIAILILSSWWMQSIISTKFGVCLFSKKNK